MYKDVLQKKGFCFDIRGEADPINDDHNIKGYNVDEYVSKLNWSTWSFHKNQDILYRWTNSLIWWKATEPIS